MSNFKPEGYPSVSVYIMADGSQRVIDFLRDALADSIVMISDATPAWPAFPVWVHVYVPDVDASYKRALEVGGVSEQEPREKEGDPDRRCSVKDPAGNSSFLSTQIQK